MATCYGHMMRTRLLLLNKSCSLLTHYFEKSSVHGCIHFFWVLFYFWVLGFFMCFLRHRDYAGNAMNQATWPETLLYFLYHVFMYSIGLLVVALHLKWAER